MYNYFLPFKQMLLKEKRRRKKMKQTTDVLLSLSLTRRKGSMVLLIQVQTATFLLTPTQ